MDYWNSSLFIYITIFVLFIFLLKMNLIANTITEGMMTKSN